MRLSILSLPLLAAPALAFNPAADAFKWANGLVSTSDGDAQASAHAQDGGVVHTFDAWSYVDCGGSSSLSVSLHPFSGDGAGRRQADRGRSR